MHPERFIVHADMDAFFAAVEQRDNPALRGKPVVVGADPKGGKGRGVVSTCSYEARKFGIHSAMPISQAYRLCPHACFVPVHGKKYGEESEKIYAIFSRFSGEIEPVSVDEAFLDITTSWKLFGKAPRDTCMKLKATVKSETGLTVSVGLAPNKFAAKIASDLKKPDGFFEVDRAGLLDFLGPLDIAKIPGLGPKAKGVLNARGVENIAQLALLTTKEATDLLGSSGEYFWRLANGLDPRTIETGRETKSCSAETTFQEDVSEQDTLETALLELAEKVASRLREDGMETAQTGFKIRLEDFETFTRAAPKREPTQFAADLYADALALLRGFDRKGKKVRLLGIRAGELISKEDDLRLFRPPQDAKRSALANAMDDIRKRYGFRSIMPGRTITPPDKK
jgi:nucleotidyltransferase/DNA polymerase involved in DNA repair